jgi:hypothetical protein
LLGADDEGLGRVLMYQPPTPTSSPASQRRRGFRREGVINLLFKLGLLGEGLLGLDRVTAISRNVRSYRRR